MLRVIQVNRFNCGAENNAGTLQREAEMLRERQAVILSYVNFQKLFPVIVSIVDCGVIVLLLAADKPLEEFWSPLDSIRTPSDTVLAQTHMQERLCSSKMMQHEDRRQTHKQTAHLSTGFSIGY